MNGLPPFVFSLFVLIGLPPASVQVRIEQAGGDGCLDHPTITVTSCAGEHCVENVYTDSPVAIGIPSGASEIRVRSVAEGCWGETAEFTSSDVPKDLMLRLWPLAIATGRLENGSLAQGKVTATITGPDFRLPQPVECAVDRSLLTCFLPSISDLDLKIVPTGYAAEYFFDLKQRTIGIFELPNRTLRPGGSVAGRVADREGIGIPEAELRLIPEPMTSRNQPHPPAAIDKSSEQGFFQFAGIPSGTYFIQSIAEGLSNVTVRLVEVDEGVETFLRDPLVHLPLQALHLWFDPPTSTDGSSWRVALSKADGARMGGHAAVPERADADGEWNATQIEAGEYRILIADSNGNVRKEDLVVLDRGRNELFMDMRGIPIQGRVTAGGEHLECSLIFRRGAREVTLRTDGTGSFDGFLPDSGAYTVLVEPAGVRLRIRRSVVVEIPEEGDFRLNIDLPGGRLRGEVVDDRGNLIASDVHLIKEDTPEAYLFTEDGSFEFIGLEIGEATVVATANRVRGEPQHVTIREHQTSEVKLTVAEEVIVRGMVTDSEGRGIAGALLRFVGASFLGAEVVSDLTGSFRLSAPRSAELIHGAVLAPGFPVHFLSIRPNSGMLVTVRLSRMGGILAIRLAGAPPWPELSWEGIRVPLNLILFPPGVPGGHPRPSSEEGLRFLLVPGQYTVCHARPAGRCETTFLMPHQQALIDLSREE